MRSTVWFSVLGAATLLMAGCNRESSATTSEDDAFNKQLAAAAAKNKDAPTKPSTRGQVPTNLPMGSSSGTSKPGPAAAGPNGK